MRIDCVRQTIRPGGGRVLVGDSSRADNRTRRDSARPPGVGEQLAEVKDHVDAGVWPAAGPTIDMHPQRQVQLAVQPGVAKFVGGYRYRREGAGWLGLKEAKAFGQLAGE
jgi:hypothetical protein